jgi:Lar family restriction alleviation protein
MKHVKKKHSAVARKQRAFKTKPCPFCGGQAYVWGSGVIISTHVVCDSCGAAGPEVFSRPDEEEIDCAFRAVQAWNSRIRLLISSSVR